MLESGTDIAFGGLGAVHVMYTRFVGTDAVAVCGEGAVVLDHALTFGGGGCGVASSVNAKSYGDSNHEEGDRLAFGYGGAIIRYHFFSRKMLNFSVGGIVGAGGISIVNCLPTENSSTKSCTPKSSEAVFVTEPQVGGYLNITRWMRFAALMGYRVVGGTEMRGLSSGQLSGLAAGGSVQFGWF